MSVNLSPGKRYSITGRVELEQVQYSDFITLREEDAAGNTISVLASYWGCTIDDIHLITKNTTGRIRVDIYCFYGATAATSGFEFTIVPATTETIEVGHVLGALGIGTSTPQKELHVVGDVRVSSNNGKWMQLSSSNRYPLFSTNAEMFDFNKPVRSDGFASPRYSDLVFSTYDTPRVTIDDTTGYVGIGTTNPQEKLDIRGMLRIQTDGGWVKLGPMNWGFMHFYTDRPKFYFNKPISIQGGIISSIERVDLKLQTFNTTHLTIQYGTGNIGIGIDTPLYKLDVVGKIHASDSILCNVVKAPYARISQLQATGITSSNLSTYTISARSDVLTVTAPTLDCAGKIRANEIIINSNSGADFVFERDYNLRTLDEVNSFIKENQHLPDIPSAEQMQEDGMSVDQIVIKLLQKIEELTLYTIQQEERIKDLEQRHPQK